MRLPRGLKVTPVSSDPRCSGPVAVRNRATRRRGVIRPMSSSSVGRCPRTRRGRPARDAVRLSTPVSGGLARDARRRARPCGAGACRRRAPVVGRGGHVDDAAVEPDALAAGEPGGGGHLLAGGGGLRRRVGHLAPAHAPLGRTTATSSFPWARLGQRRGREAVEAAVAHVLGQVHPPPARVHRGGLVLEHAHGRAGHRTLAPLGSHSHTPARCPPPRTRATCPTAWPRPSSSRPCPRGSGTRRGSPALVEADRAGAAAGPRRRLAVGHQDPPAVGRGVGGLAVREDVPLVVVPGTRWVRGPRCGT